MKSSLILILIFVFSIGLIGQKRKQTLDLKISLELENKNICIGDTADLIVKIKNQSTRQLTIDVEQIGQFFAFDRYFSKSRRDEEVSFVTGHGPWAQFNPKLKILKPGESYIKIEKFVFDPINFVKSGRYQLSMTYNPFFPSRYENPDLWQGAAGSNKFFVFVNQCHKIKNT